MKKTYDFVAAWLFLGSVAFAVGSGAAWQNNPKSGLWLALALVAIIIAVAFGSCLVCEALQEKNDV